MASETIATRITRLETELTQARALRDKLETAGQSGSVAGVANYVLPQYELVLKRINRIEEQLENLYQRQAGETPTGGVNYGKFVSG